MLDRRGDLLAAPAPEPRVAQLAEALELALLVAGVDQIEPVLARAARVLLGEPAVELRDELGGRLGVRRQAGDLARMLVRVEAQHCGHDLVRLPRDVLALEVARVDAEVLALSMADHRGEQVAHAVDRHDDRVLHVGAVVRRGHVAQVVVEAQVELAAREVAGFDREAVVVAVAPDLLSVEEPRELRGALGDRRREQAVPEAVGVELALADRPASRVEARDGERRVVQRIHLRGRRVAEVRHPPLQLDAGEALLAGAENRDAGVVHQAQTRAVALVDPRGHGGRPAPAAVVARHLHCWRPNGSGTGKLSGPSAAAGCTSPRRVPATRSEARPSQPSTGRWAPGRAARRPGMSLIRAGSSPRIEFVPSRTVTGRSVLS